MILVVDDDEFQLEVIGAQLAALGWQDVLLAQSGEMALEHYERHKQHIDVIICDLSMPVMDGLVLMRHLAQRGFAASFILLSGVHDEILNSAAGLAIAHQLDLLGVMAKPCEPERLRDLLASRQPRVTGFLPQIVDQALTTQRLQRALAGEEFIPWYQPKVNIVSKKTESVEALARWPQESGGMIGPGLFIPAIEAAGLSDALFFSMVRQILHDLADWRRRGMLIKAAINMSMDTAQNLSMPERLQQLVEAAGLHPHDLIIEVTESKLMAERTLAMETLTRLSMMGFILSIDDFGTGYSSLSQLVDLPFKELKIDASFVQRASTERKAKAILRISLTIGVNLDMGVIAEGVETLEQMEYLRECGCTVAQGYYFSRPLALSACTTWLEREAVNA